MKQQGCRYVFSRDVDIVLSRVLKEIKAGKKV